MRAFRPLVALLLLSSSAAAQTALPAGSDDALARLQGSPRHGEWVEIDAGDAGPVNTWVVYPERGENAPVVVVIHEIFGLTDWIRSVADALAAEGFIALAPDLLSGKGPDGGGTESLEAPTRTIRDLDALEVKARLDAIAAYGTALPAATDRFGVIGFCWGGSTSFLYATRQPSAGAAVVYYGGAPSAEDLAQLQVPVLGLYGGNDNRVNASIEPAREVIAQRNQRYEVEIYDGAGHGFLRAQTHEELGAANRQATEQAWPRMVGFLRELLER